MKEIGVPQGAPTSCSLATLSLRDLERDKKVLLYADDIIYFPENSQEDPKVALENQARGREVNTDKSRWLKKDNV
jgi:hypothetical protein